MLLKLFRQNDRISFVFIFLWLTLITILILVFTTGEPTFSCFISTGLKSWLQKYLSHNISSNLNKIIFFALFLVNSVYVNRLTLSYNIINSPGNLPMLFYIVFSIPALKFYSDFANILISNTLVIIVFDLLLKTSEKKGFAIQYLSIGILLSLAAFLYKPMLLFIPFVFVAQQILGHLTFREFFYTLIGLALPFIYLVSYHYLLDKDYENTRTLINYYLELKQVFAFNWQRMLLMYTIILLHLIYSARAYEIYTKIKVIRRRYLSISVFLFINSLCVLFFVPGTGIEMLFFLAIPSSILFSIFFSNCKLNLLNKIVFSVVAYIFPLVWLFS